MPNRILKESICTSDSIDQLSAFEETVFYRLIVNCDDFGRFDGRPKIIASKLFPLKDIRTNQIESALRALTSAELVILYEVDGKPFLQMKTWDRHQQIRAKKSKYPAPESGNITSASICNQMISDDSTCPRNPIQSESESESNTKDNVRVNRNFEKFWVIYPKKVGKGAAEKAFDRIHVTDDLMNVMIDAIAKAKQSAQWQEENGRFIPNPATWLNQRRWEDEPQKPSQYKPVKTVSAAQYTQRDYTEEEYEQMLDVNGLFRKGAS